MNLEPVLLPGYRCQLHDDQYRTANEYENSKIGRNLFKTVMRDRVKHIMIILFYYLSNDEPFDVIIFTLSIAIAFDHYIIRIHAQFEY